MALKTLERFRARQLTIVEDMQKPLENVFKKILERSKKPASRR